MSASNEIRYFQPGKIGELITALKEMDEKTYLYAGGTDMMIRLRNRGVFDYSIVDLTKMCCYRYIDPGSDRVTIGALTTMTDIVNDEFLKLNYRDLWRAASELGSTQIRNLATVGGNICNASQSADLVPALLLHDAEVIVMDTNGDKLSIPIDSFIVGRGKTVLKPRQVVVAVVLNKLPGYTSFVKLGSRIAVTISKINCSMNVIVEEGIVESVKCYIGVIGEKALRAEAVESAIKGKEVSKLGIEELADVGFETVQQAIPDRSSRYYKRIAIKGVLADIIEDIRSQI